MAVSLSLKTLRCPEGVGQDRREITRVPFSIGRGTESDWVLLDPDKVLSKRHCNITAKGESWLITDISSNGTYLNGSELDSELPHPLRDRDRLTLGQYELEVSVAEHDDDEDASEAVTRFGNWSDKANQSRLTSDPFPPQEEHPAESPHPSIGLPMNFDALNDSDRVAEHPYAARDDTPDMASNFQPPRPTSDLLPDDWDADASRPAPLTRPSQPEPPAPTRPHAERPPADAGEPGEPASADVSGSTGSELQAEYDPLSIEVRSRRVLRAESAEPPPEPEPPRQPPARQRPGGDASVADAEGFAAFAAGAGYRGPAPGDPGEALRSLGASFRAMVSGLRQSIIARASVKTEFRIDQTMIRAAGNNPIKFAADDDDALAALIGVHRSAGVSAQDAVAGAMRDIAMHELAVASAMQRAVGDLLAELAPDKIMRGVRRTRLDELIGSRKQSSWDAYVERHAEVARALEDEFDSIFGKSFARAYEAALREVSAANDEDNES